MSPQKGRGKTVLAQGWHHGLENPKNLTKSQDTRLLSEINIFCMPKINNKQLEF